MSFLVSLVGPPKTDSSGNEQIFGSSFELIINRHERNPTHTDTHIHTRQEHWNRTEINVVKSVGDGLLGGFLGTRQIALHLFIIITTVKSFKSHFNGSRCQELQLKYAG